MEHKRNDALIKRKFYQYLIPGIIMVIAMQFGSLADGIIIGNFLKESALSASSLALPIIYVSQLPGFMMAIGASIVIANLLGKRDIEKANKVYKVALCFAFFISALFIPVGIFASEGIAGLICGESFAELVPLVSGYVRAYLLQAPIIGTGLVIAYCLSSDNNPHLSAAFFIIANVVHVGVEILFCMFGDPQYQMMLCGFSIGIGMLVGFLVLIPYAKSKNRQLKFILGFKGLLKQLVPVLRSGATQGATFLLLAVYAFVLNIAATSYFTNGSALAVYAMMQNFTFLVDLFVTGILQIMPALIGALYGEKDYFSVRSLTKRVLLMALAVASVLTIVSEIYPEMFFHIFGVNVEEAKASLDANFIIRIYCISFLIYTVNKFIVTYYPSIFINAPGVISTIIRNGVVGLPVLYVLMMHQAALGYSIGTIIAEASALVLTLAFVLIMKKANRYHGNGLLLIPKANRSEFAEFSFPSNPDEIGEFSEELQGYANKLCKDEIIANQITIAAEEIIANVIHYGYSKRRNRPYIDVSMSIVEDKVVVRVRDDGIPFDPTSQEIPDDELSFSGIEIIKKLSSNFTYARILNTNNTVIEIDCPSA